MEKPVLCLSWLNGQLKAVAADRGRVVGTWERPALVADFNEFANVLAEAMEKTRSDCKLVAIVLAHPRLSHQLVEVPPVKGRPLERVLQRNVQRLKTFDGDGAWAAQSAMRTKNSTAVLLHIFPQSLVDQLSAGCEQLGLQLVRLLPTAAVLGSHLKQLTLQKDELALLAAETGTTTTVVIGRSDGRVCLGRMLRGRWNQQLESLGVDLTRTIGFAEQQSGHQVSSVWLLGAGAQAQAPALRTLLHLPVQPSPVECTPLYWAEQAANLPDQDDGNFITRAVREAPLRRRLATMTSLILLFFFIVSLATAGFMEVVRHGWVQAVEKEDMELVKLREKKTDWQQRTSDLERKLDLIRIVLDEKPPPVPVWFLGYMSEVVPENLFLSELRVTRTNDAWFVKMSGAAQPATNATPADFFRQAAATMTNKLATGPFHLRISHSVINDGMAGALTGQNPGNGNNFTFSIEGLIQ